MTDTYDDDYGWVPGVSLGCDREWCLGGGGGEGESESERGGVLMDEESEWNNG